MICASINLDRNKFVFKPRQVVWSAKLCVLAGVFIIGGCQTPAERISIQATELGLVRELLQGTRYRHVSYLSGPSDADALHVYIDGDGSPWRQRNRVSTDPTPKRAIMLELMSIDSTKSLYLGRPCYHGLANDLCCTPWLWTHGRYSVIVVDSMEAALRSYVQHAPPQRLRFFGFSGGGALAVLLAARFPETDTVVTIAGNLDIEAWAQHHGYTPLTGSLNPASLPPLDRSVRQLHLVGLRDAIVPPVLVERYLQGQPHSELIRYPEFDHNCCWREIWPSMMTRIH